MKSKPRETNRYSLYVLITVFFFWGFVAASNTVLIPFFKDNFDLLQWQSQLVDLAFYAAYFLGSLAYFLVSTRVGDPLNRLGYKKGLVLGFLISGCGAALFYPAASMGSFGLLLLALSVIGLGFTLQQIVANPYMVAIGDPATGAHRINMAQGVNSLGTMTGPLLISWALFGQVQGETARELTVVQIPYLILAGCLVLFAILLGRSHLPAITSPEKMKHDLGALRFPQLVLGMVAIFVYVGVEVSIQSNLPALMADPAMLGLDHTQTVHYISLYWGSLMIGRWTGSIGVFQVTRTIKKLLWIVVPLVAFAVILGVNQIKGSPMQDLLGYLPFIFICILGFFMGKDQPARTLLLFSLLGMIMMLAGIFLDGQLAVFAFVSGGLFCSIMWPCIFALSIAGLGKYTNQGSSLLVMMILGGALIPPLQGYVADLTGIHMSYWIPVLCFGFLAFYAWRVKAVLEAQGIRYDTMDQEHIEPV
ncbi:MAG: MFS transporter [Saprospiraceae bacterium]